MNISKLILAMLLPFLNLGFNIVPDEGGGDSGSDGEDNSQDDSGDNTDTKDQKSSESDKKQISDSEAKLLKDVMAKKTALKEANDNLKALNDKLKTFDGIDPEQVRALLKAQKDAEDEKLVAQGNWDKLKTQMAEAHTAEMTGVNAKLAELQERLNAKESVIAELTVGASFANSEFIREELLLTPNKTRQVYGAHFGFEDGVIVGYDKPASAKDRTVLVDASGEPLSFENALRKIVDLDSDRDHILKSKVKQGSGSKTTVKTKTPDTKSETVETGRGRITSALSDFLNKK
jgi:hypothetical protein